MYPQGGIRARLLAAVAAFMAVTAGVPRVQCVCPDGRVKFFCLGRSASGCCCSASSAPTSAEANPRCCLAACGSLTPRTHAAPESPPAPADEGEIGPVKTCGCVRTVVAEAAAYVAQEVGDASRFQPDVLVTWEVTLVASEQTARLAQTAPRLLIPPPDLIVVLSHFTC